MHSIRDTSSRSSTGPKVGTSRTASSGIPSANAANVNHMATDQFSQPLQRWLDECDRTYLYTEPAEDIREPARMDLSSATEAQPAYERNAPYGRTQRITRVQNAVERCRVEMDLLYVGAFAESAEEYPTSISLDYVNHLQSLSSGLKTIVSNTTAIISRLDYLVKNIADIELV